MNSLQHHCVPLLTCLPLALFAFLPGCTARSGPNLDPDMSDTQAGATAPDPAMAKQARTASRYSGSIRSATRRFGPMRCACMK